MRLSIKGLGQGGHSAGQGYYRACPVAGGSDANLVARMPLDVAIVAEFAIACALLTGGLMVIGFPVKAWLLDGPGERSPVPSVVAGLAVVQVVGWYWLRAGGEGLKTPMAVLLVAGAVASVAALIRRGVPRPGRE